MKRSPNVLAAGLAGAALCFLLGWLASRWSAPAPAPPPSAAAVTDALDTGPHDPILLIDASSIVLLPDASLRLDLPAAPEP